MSSLIQFRGQIDRRGVGLMAYLTRPVHKYGSETTEPAETFTTPDGKELPVLYRFFRKPAGMWGCWVVFRYLGEEHVPDLSCPFGVPAIPRGAQKLTDAESLDYWRKHTPNL